MVERIERNKDLVQELVESTATHVGQIATIITGAVVDVAREVGEIFTDGFEMREAAQRAAVDGGSDTPATAESDGDADADIVTPDSIEPGQTD
ncbi:hypothetical protein QSJ18_17110 [Gordonia sp. ABSL1-1]|uniref:hypothetical protein n=1 Tax=Gordonia sp. ABSL1-1 TaxID=3053923 RepID=UPI00257466DB|nr:hypothetical protein [Gordonia sp. ABSL1-1]MDL9938470.1 hypothetical protein [Gordonia sp. ABSL1-1]